MALRFDDDFMEPKRDIAAHNMAREQSQNQAGKTLCGGPHLDSIS
jgi:hypothetical protein